MMGAMASARKIATRHALGILGVALTVAVPVSAATDIRETKTGLVATSVEHVLDVMASGDICDEGCRYYGPHIKREVKLSHLATKNEYYKWTHVTGVKTVKFFKHFRITPGEVTRLDVRTLTEEHDKALIDELERETGFEHDPAFDVSTATYTITARGGQVEVKLDAMTRVSGVMTVFAGMVRKEMKKSLEAIFRNFTR